MRIQKLSKERMKLMHDKYIMRREFLPGQKVLLFSSRLQLFPGKMRSKWTGTLYRQVCFSTCDVTLMNEKDGHEFKVNGQRLKTLP